MRVISGSRRKTSFGDAATTQVEGRRRSVVGAGGAGAGIEGTWYWRVQAGVVDVSSYVSLQNADVQGQIVLLPLSQPPNPLLTAAPAPLSNAMPSHSTTAAGTRPDPADEQGLSSKIKNIFRRSSASSPSKPTKPLPVEHGEPERILDQTATNEMEPSPSANAIGATNLNANAESTWPGVIDGEKLAGVVVDLRSVEKGKVHLGGGGKKESSWVMVPVTGHFANLVHPMLESVGKTQQEHWPKSGSIKFEFDKEWIGAKGYVDQLGHG